MQIRYFGGFKRCFSLGGGNDISPFFLRYGEGYGGEDQDDAYHQAHRERLAEEANAYRHRRQRLEGADDGGSGAAYVLG